MTGFAGGKIPPKFAQFDRTDIGPFVAEIETITSKLAREVARNEDDRIRSVLREAFDAGYELGHDHGRGYYSDVSPDFDEWLAGFIANIVQPKED